jgi:hypothetical protein
MAKTRDGPTPYVDQMIGQIREINERIIDAARQRGKAALQAYSQLLRSVAEGQEAAGERAANWLHASAEAQAKFSRELSATLPKAARSAIKQASGLADAAAEQARRVPGIGQAEGAARGTAAREQDLPIRDYDELTASQVTERLQGLSAPDLRKIDAYERKHGNRKTVHKKIQALTG